MPAPKRQTVSTPTPNTPYPPPVATDATETPSDGRRYQTRRVALKFSHTKTPYVPPPRPPRERPPVPKSVAQKGPKSTQSTNATNEQTPDQALSLTTTKPTQQAKSESIPQCESEKTTPDVSVPKALSTIQSLSNAPIPKLASTMEAIPNVPDPESQLSCSVLNPVPQPAPSVSNPMPTSVTPYSAGAQIESLVSASYTQEDSGSRLPTIPEYVEIGRNNSFAGADTALVHHNSQVATVTPSSNHFATPRRANRPAGFATPALVIIQNSQDYYDSQFPTFVPNSTIPFNTSVLSIRLPPHLSPCQNYNQQSSFGPWTPSQSEFAPPESGSVVLSGFHDTKDLNQDVFQAPCATLAAVPVAKAPNTDVNMLYTAILSTLPPSLPAAPLASAGSHPFTTPGLLEVPDRTMHPDFTLRNELVITQALSTPNASSMPSGATPGNQIVRRPSLALSNAQLANTHASVPPTSAPTTNPYRPNQLRQYQFQYDEVVFGNQMKHRWGLFLATEDPFPTNILPAWEACISYAEQVLKSPRGQYPISQLFDFVRKKDSNIRNSFLSGLLLVVEQKYDINNKTSTEKLNELISNINFAHISYDLATKRLTGRYRHPCVFEVVKLVLFPKRTRGKPIGVRFIRNIMGDPGPGVKPHEIEAPIPTVALACTLILHVLHSIKAGDSSTRNPKSRKPVQWSESRYGNNYRKILSKMKKYNQIGEVQRECMAEIMKEYMIASGSTCGSDDDGVQFDDNMLSDGDIDV
ncbi:hypothetical protein RhiJN_09273 [Ceratobasidium sp. AG-Ba]|nr:hypothetical protein RhiJN_09273 [Ceratobasidium sp. AG-Ba]